MKKSILKGVGFGLTSGIITTLGLMIGLSSGTGSKIIVIAGIMLIAISDSLSDALGIHISEETERKKSHDEVWIATFATFSAKFVFTSLFIIPVLLLSLTNAIIVSIVWGIFLIALFSGYLAKKHKSSPLKTITEHVFITIFVIIATHYAGKWISTFQ